MKATILFRPSRASWRFTVERWTGTHWMDVASLWDGTEACYLASVLALYEHWTWFRVQDDGNTIHLAGPLAVARRSK